MVPKNFAEDLYASEGAQILVRPVAVLPDHVLHPIVKRVSNSRILVHSHLGIAYRWH